MHYYLAYVKCNMAAAAILNFSKNARYSKWLRPKVSTASFARANKNGHFQRSEVLKYTIFNVHHSGGCHMGNQDRYGYYITLARYSASVVREAFKKFVD